MRYGITGLVHVGDIFSGPFLNSLDGLPYFLSSRHGFFCQLAHFVRHHGKPTPGITGACGFDGRVEGKQIGLIGDIGDHVHNLTDSNSLLAQLVHILLDGHRLRVYIFYALDGITHDLRAFQSLLVGLARYVCRLLGIFGHLKHGGVHLLHGCGRLTHTGGLLVCSTARLFHLSREFFRG